MYFGSAAGGVGRWPDLFQPPWGSRDPRPAVNQFLAFAVSYAWLANVQQREKRLRYHLVVWGALLTLSVN